MSYIVLPSFFRWFDSKGGEVWIKAKKKWVSPKGGTTLIQKGGEKEEVANMGKNKEGMMDLRGGQVNIGWW